MITAEFKFTTNPNKLVEKLEKGLRNTAIRKAINKAAAPVKAAVVANAPERFGYLRKSFRIKIKQYRDSKIWVAVIGPKSDFKKSKGVRTRGKDRGNPRNYRPSAYAKLVDKGTKHFKGRHFLKSALDTAGKQFLENMAQYLTAEVELILSQKWSQFTYIPL